jgi:catalase
LKSASVRFRLVVQLAAGGDPITDASQTWPDARPLVELGTVEVRRIAENSDALQRAMIFDPMRLVDGIEPSDDPILQARPGAYSVSDRRRTASS